ncbi:uncharacterized protein PRCAT00001712001 [Priceomyces carsonii]|uniref:uncharacterized protein n=1 Tax=Priceomyces carsonii TaxID=28549 RepID=UPI002EDB6D6C|nr:unnamed protein product [Priceomyces carsonii]
MSELLAKISPSSSTVPSSKSLDRKTFQLSSSSAPTLPKVTQFEKSNEKRTSPSSKNFLSDLKSFNIDRSQYKHYGHQSLLNAQAIEKIILNSTEDEVKSTAKDDPNIALDSSRANNRIIIDERISEILGIPPQMVDEESIWPYNTETLNEILKLKTEQERTRQETIRSEYGATAVELLKLARSMNIHSDLVPFLFVSNTSVEDLGLKIERIQRDAHEVINEITAKARELTPQMKAHKRKHSDINLPSFYETAEKIRPPSSQASPLRSPIKLPPIIHRRVISDNSGVTEKETQALQTARQQSPIILKQHLPQQQTQTMQTNMYPIYYASGPQGAASGQRSQSQSNEVTTSKSLGSPYAQKYNAMKFPLTQNTFQPAPNYIPQYPYFVSSPPNNPPFMMQGQIPPGIVPAAPIHHFRSPDLERPPTSGGSVRGPVFEPEDASPYKKQKSSRNSSINFMITTPKNPPARKYNNPPKDKSG